MAKNTTTYSYNILTGTKNSAWDSPRLSQEICNSLQIQTKLSALAEVDGYINVTFYDSLDAGEESYLTYLISQHTGAQLPLDTIQLTKTQSDDVPQVALVPRVGTETVIVTHNYCDPCSWFYDSVRVNNEELIEIDGYNGKLWKTSNIFIIDMITGRVYDDDVHVASQIADNPSNAHGYQVVAEVDGYELEMCPIFLETGGDYWVDYEGGYIHTLESYDSISLSYSYSTTNTFYIRPEEDSKLRIEGAKVDFSSNVHMCDSLVYTLYTYVDIADPSSIPGIPSGTKIPVKQEKYKRISQAIASAKKMYPLVQPNGASEEDIAIENIVEFRRKSRGIKNAIHSMPFAYATSQDLIYSYGMEIRIDTTNQLPFCGEIVTATFFCTTEDE